MLLKNLSGKLLSTEVFERAEFEFTDEINERSFPFALVRYEYIYSKLDDTRLVCYLLIKITVGDVEILLVKCWY